MDTLAKFCLDAEIYLFLFLAHFLMREMVCLVNWALDKYLQNLRSVMNPAIFCLCDLDYVIPLLLFLLVFMS